MACHVFSACSTSVESRDDGVFLHDEADITIMRYVFQITDAVHLVVRILSDDSDIFVLLIYWTWRYDLQVRVAVHMEKWDGVDIISTCPNLFNVLGEESATHADFMAVGQQFLAAQYAQPMGTSMTQARYNLYTRKQGKPLGIMLLPPTDTHLYLHL